MGGRRRPLAGWRRFLGWGMLVTGGFLATAVLWLVFTGIMARDSLVEAQSQVEGLRSSLVGGDLREADRIAQAVEAETQRARALTDGPVWAMASLVPGGEPAARVRDLTASADDLGRGALPAMVAAGVALDPSDVRRADGSLDLARFTAALPQLDRARGSASAAGERLDRASGTTWLSEVDAARNQLAGQISELRSQLQTLETGVRLAPSMLGSDGPKHYLVAFQNEAEARGTGGLPGAFAMMHADAGKITFTHFGSDDMLGGASADVEFGPAYDQMYAGAKTSSLYGNANLSPHFPYAASIWASMWQQRSGERVDGVMAVDPTVLSYLLAVRGPVPLPDGTAVRADNVIALTQSTVYARFGDDLEGRKAFLLQLAESVATHVTDSQGATKDMVQALGRAVAERRLLVWSAYPELQARLETTPLSGAIPETSAPYVGLSVVNDGGNKLDYYLGRQLTWRRQGCNRTRDVTVTIILTNSAPATGLPSYVTERSDQRSYAVEAGDNRLGVSYFATAGAVMKGVSVDGQPGTSRIGSERGHPVYTIDLEIPRGTSRTVELSLTEPAGEGPPDVLRQPLVRPMSIEVQDAQCPASAS